MKSYLILFTLLIHVPYSAWFIGVCYSKEKRLFSQAFIKLLFRLRRRLTFLAHALTCIPCLMFQSETRHNKMGCGPLFEHSFLVFSSGTVCTQWHMEWCINWLKWSDPEIGQAPWLPLTEMKTSSGGLLCVDMFILLCCEPRISEELQDKAVIRLHHHCLESRTLFTSFDT